MAAHDYWRLKFTDYVGGGAEVALSVPEVQLRASIGGADECVGGVATYDSPLDGNHQPGGGFGNDPSAAFDDDGNTVFITDSYELPTGGAPIYLRYAFAAPVDIVEMAVQGVADGAINPINFANAPKAWVLQYSDDDVGYTDVFTISGQIAWLAGEMRVFSGWIPAEFDADITDADDTLVSNANLYELSIDQYIVMDSIGRADRIAEMLSGAVEMGDSVLDIDIPAIRERISLTGAASATAELLNQLADEGVFEETLHVAWSLLIAESMELAGAAADQPVKLGAIVDTMVATGLSSSRMEAVAAVAAAMTMQGLVSNGWSAEAVDAVVFESTLTHNIAILKTILDSAQLSDDTEYALTITAVLGDAALMDATLSTLAVLNAEASEQILFYSSLRLGPDTFDGWVINHKLAASRYTNFPFESMAFFNGQGYGAGDGGIFRLGGSTDDGDPIEAYVRTGLSDFGTSKIKNVPEAFFGQDGEGRIVVKTITTSTTGQKVEDWYVQVPNDGNAPREGYIKLGPGVNSKYWQFELHNKAGGELNITDFNFVPMVITRRK